MPFRNLWLTASMIGVALLLGLGRAGAASAAVDGRTAAGPGGRLPFAPAGRNAGIGLFSPPAVPHPGWNTFLGEGGSDYGYGIAVDGDGNIYVTGDSAAGWGTPVKAHSGGGYDAFVAKLDPAGEIVWNTFLGGGATDLGATIAADGSGNVYIAGFSDASWGNPVRAFAGASDAFAAKLDSSGGLVWSTFLGGNGFDAGNGIAVDGAGNIFLTGYSTAGWGFPVRAYTGDYDGFTAKLDSSGALVWNTFLGGSGEDQGLKIAHDGSGNVYASGYSASSWGSPLTAYADLLDAYVVRLNSSTGALVWNAFYGGFANDIGYAVAADGNGNVYLSGWSGSAWGLPVRAFSSGSDAFLCEIGSDGWPIWNTFLGGDGDDLGTGVAVDGSGEIFVSGYGNASWGDPISPYAGGTDAFAAQINSNGWMAWNTFMGGEGSDLGTAVAIRGREAIYVTGYSSAGWGSPVRAYSGGSDAFIAKLENPAPGPFGKLSPADGAYASTGPAISWNASDGADFYVYCADTVDNGICDTTWVNNGSSTNAVLTGLANDETYYWFVAANGSSGTTYADGGAWWTFTARNQTFTDVPINHSLWQYIEAFYASGITTGCGVSPLIYCPEVNVTRASMAVFLLRAKYGAGYTPPAARHFFSDLPVAGKEWQEAWVDQFYSEGITGGCGTSPLRYCPENPVTRAAMAVFILRALEGSSYTPPAASHFFTDMPVAGKEWMEPWVDELYRRGITTGCGTGPLIYCPETAVKRQAMAAFIVRAFNLPLP